MDAVAIPFPNPERTPPVTMIYFIGILWKVLSDLKRLLLIKMGCAKIIYVCFFFCCCDINLLF